MHDRGLVRYTVLYSQRITPFILQGFMCLYLAEKAQLLREFPKELIVSVGMERAKTAFQLTGQNLSHYRYVSPALLRAFR